MALFEHLYRDENPTGACARLALTEVKQKFLFHSAIAVEAFFKFGNVARRCLQSVGIRAVSLFFQRLWAARDSIAFSAGLYRRRTDSRRVDV